MFCNMISFENKDKTEEMKTKHPVLLSLFLCTLVAQVKFGHLGFCMGKRETVDFSDSFAACCIKVDLCSQLNELL